jgi:hypothetical protein
VTVLTIPIWIGLFCKKQEAYTFILEQPVSIWFILILIEMYISLYLEMIHPADEGATASSSPICNWYLSDSGGLDPE